MIPWSTILRHAPAVLAAADALLARAKSSKPDGRAPAIEERFGKLEQTSRESAQLLHDMALQIEALAVAHQVTAKRARVALTVGAIAVVLALCAGMFAIFW